MESLWILASWPEDRIVKIFVEYRFFRKKLFHVYDKYTWKGKRKFR